MKTISKYESLRLENQRCFPLYACAKEVIRQYRKPLAELNLKDGFYTQPMAFGGEEGLDRFDKNIRYRESLQNYLIDAGEEVILVDNGLPAGTPEEVPDEDSIAFTGKDICSYMEAFAALVYKPEQVTRILLTHRHSDHSGEIRSFPNSPTWTKLCMRTSCLWICLRSVRA